MSITTRLETKGIDRILRELEPKAEALIDKTAFEIQARAQNAAPVDTGALRNSIYTVTQRSNGYRDAARRAKASNPKAVIAPFPEPSGNLEAHIGPSVEYAIYQEMGTSKMSAHPFLVPAVEALRKSWEAAWKALFRSLA